MSEAATRPTWRPSTGLEQARAPRNILAALCRAWKRAWQTCDAGWLYDRRPNTGRHSTRRRQEMTARRTVEQLCARLPADRCPYVSPPTYPSIAGIGRAGFLKFGTQLQTLCGDRMFFILIALD